MASKQQQKHEQSRKAAYVEQALQDYGGRDTNNKWRKKTGGGLVLLRWWGKRIALRFAFRSRPRDIFLYRKVKVAPTSKGGDGNGVRGHPADCQLHPLYKGRNRINIKCLLFLVWYCFAITWAFLCRGSDSIKECSCAGKRRLNKTQQATAKQGNETENEDNGRHWVFF